MVAAHVLDERRLDGTLTRTSWVVDGRASALFAVLAGVSLVLMSRRTNAVGLAVRALLIALLGLVLGGLGTGLAIILTYYGLLFLLGLPFLGLRARALFAWAAAWVVVAPVVSHLVRPHLAPRSGPSPAFDQLSNPGHLLAELLLTGYYPCLPWLAYLLLGMAIGRCDLRSRSVQTRLVVGGLAVAVVAFVVSRSFTEQPWVLRRLVPDAARYGDVSTRRRVRQRHLGWHARHHPRGRLVGLAAGGGAAQRDAVRPARRQVRRRPWSSGSACGWSRGSGTHPAARSRSCSAPGR